MGALDGYAALVTGASRGIGKGCALELGAAGATVYATGRTRREGDAPLPGSLEETVREVEALGGRAVGVACGSVRRPTQSFRNPRRSTAQAPRGHRGGRFRTSSTR